MAFLSHSRVWLQDGAWKAPQLKDEEKMWVEAGGMMLRGHGGAFQLPTFWGVQKLGVKSKWALNVGMFLDYVQPQKPAQHF